MLIAVVMVQMPTATEMHAYALLHRFECLDCIINCSTGEALRGYKTISLDSKIKQDNLEHIMMGYEITYIT